MTSLPSRVRKQAEERVQMRNWNEHRGFLSSETVFDRPDPGFWARNRILLEEHAKIASGGDMWAPERRNGQPFRRFGPPTSVQEETKPCWTRFRPFKRSKRCARCRTAENRWVVAQQVLHDR